MRYSYRCDKGHEVHVKRAIISCPAMIKGKPCPGKLTRIGDGSRPRIRKAAPPLLSPPERTP